MAQAGPGPPSGAGAKRLCRYERYSIAEFGYRLALMHGVDGEPIEGDTSTPTIRIQASRSQSPKPDECESPSTLRNTRLGVA